MNLAALAVLAPILIAVGGVVAYLLAKVLHGKNLRWTGAFSAAWLAAVFVLLLAAGITGSFGEVVSLGPVLQPTALGVAFALLVTFLGAAAALASMGRLAPDGPLQLYYPLLLFALAGASAAGFARDLFTLFVAVELSAIPSYALVAYLRKDEPRAIQAAVKYLLQGVTGTLTALFGVSLLYIAGHTLLIGDLPRALAGSDPVLLAAAATLITVGYGVKLGVVPLHTWLPDAYSYAPAGVTAVMAGAAKAGSLLALILSLAALPAGGASVFAGIVLLVLSVLTMTAGNLLALAQTDVRRLLAYSSIAQMGYILLPLGIALAYGLATGILAGLFYAVAYGLMKGGAFLSADLLAADAGSTETSRMKGVGGRNPVVGVAFAIFILGLVGVPATAGFVGKALIFLAGMSTLTWGGVALALVLAANSALSLGYYVPLVSTIFFGGDAGEGHGAPPGKRIPLPGTIAVVLLALATVALGFFPGAIAGWLGTASAYFPWGMI
ncbi:MAG TPA: NADH-quinone oxidoreductase subunit N [Methanomicrobiales archaeon]|nr:NADH-quinone oxidoreductase subunit N [Methanomicrobiales archaeon]